MINTNNAQQKIDLIKEYLEPTGLTIKELMDRNIYSSLSQLLDAYHNEMNKTQSSIKNQFKEKGNQLDQVYGAIKEPSNNYQMKTAMQELIDDLREFRDEQTSPLVISRMNKVLLKASSMLEKEKEIIIDAYKQGVVDEYGDSIDLTTITEAEEYYNETFNKKIEDLK